jgi:hypothetical protein
MLDRAGVGESEPIGLFDNLEAVREITCRILIARPDSREELDAELHGFSVKRCWLQRI